MRGLRSTLVLVIVLAGLLGYIYYLNSRDPAASDTTESAFTDVKADAIEEVQIKADDGQITRVQKADGTWRIVEPEQAPADQGEMSTITSSLADLDIQRVVEENATDLKPYGLDPARMEVAFRSAGDEEPRRIHLGERTPTGGDLYARIPDQPRVFLVSSFLDTTFNKNTFALRDKSIITIDREKVDRIEIGADKRNVTLTKEGTEWRLVAPITARADFAAVESALERLSSAQMQGIVAAGGGDLKQYGLEPPVATVSAISGSSRATLLFGETENALIYAKDASRPMVFTVAPTLYTDIVRDVGEFRRKDLFDSRSFTATRVEFTRGSETITLEKSKNADETETWRNVGANKDLDAREVEELLAQITGLRAESFETAVHPALKNPVLTVNVRFDDNKMEEVVFGRASNDVFASRADEPGTATVLADSFDEVMKGMDEMK